MNSTKTYADFPPYVKKKKIKSTLSSCSNDDLNIDYLSLPFLTFLYIEDSKSNLDKFVKSDLLESSLFCGALKKIAELREAALDRQLADFLEGGVFGADLNSNLIEILKTCPVTNLTGERLFGDFDFDLQKRRNTSLLKYVEAQ